jgi:hypothetical protein
MIEPLEDRRLLSGSASIASATPVPVAVAVWGQPAVQTFATLTGFDTSGLDTSRSQTYPEAILSWGDGQRTREQTIFLNVPGQLYADSDHIYRSAGKATRRGL